MRKFLKGFILGLLISVSVSTLAIIGGGIIQHNHSGATSGGQTLNNTILNNATLNGPTISGTITGGVTTTQAVIGSTSSDISTDICVKGTAKGIRLGTSASGGTMDGVDNTCVGSFQPLTISGTNISLLSQTSGTNVSIDTTGSLTSSKACATNYTRIAPNVCIRNTNIWQQTTINTTCTTIASPVSGAKALIGFFTTSIASNNTANTNITNTINVYTSSACSVPLGTASTIYREWTATIAGTQIGLQSLGTQILFPPDATGAYAIFSTTGHANNAGSWVMVGYMD